MHLHRLALRSGASLLAALLIAASLSSATTASNRPVTAATSTSRAGTDLSKIRSQMKYHRRVTSPSKPVNVRRIAAKPAKARPTATLPPLLRQTRAAKPSNRRTVVVAPPAPTMATLNTDDAAAGTPFDGLSSASGPLTNVEPPDPWVAVGPDHIVQAVNLSMNVTDRQGGAGVSGSLPDFFLLPLNRFDSDPHVLYDSLHGRWIATEVSWDCSATGGAAFGHGFIDFAVSATTDPTGTWSVGSISFPDQLPDYPAPGTSTDKVGIASNLYDMAAPVAGDCLANATFAGSIVDYMDWSDILNLGSNDVIELVADPTVFTYRVATQAPATSATLFQVGEFDNGVPGELNIVLFTVIGSVVANTFNFGAAFDLTSDGIISPSLDPPQPIQPGANTIDFALDLRITDAIWQGNRLAFVSTYPCGAGPRDCVRVSELNTSAMTAFVDPTLTQDFLVNEATTDLFLGGIGLSGDGTLHVGWTRTANSGSNYPSSYTAHQALGDTAGSISNPEELATGTAVYTGERWGDYVGMAQDPQVPNQVWDANEYSGGADWLTKVTPLQTAGTTYVPITPTRVLDTRFNTGLTGPFTSNTARSWMVAGFSPIPGNAVAVTGNVTVTGQQSAGYVSVTVTPTNSPPSSTINFPAGVTRANNVTIPLASNGKLSAVFRGAPGKKTNLVFDVTGYFLADTSGGTFTPVTPIRAIDTRFNTGLAGKFDANVPRHLTIAGVVGTIPSDATAITGNFTIVGPTKGGYASVTKDDVVNPSTSTINFPAGVNQANGVFAPLNGTGQLSIVYKSVPGAKADVLLDITGYFEAGTGGLEFVPLNPSRIMDTRPTAVLSGLTGKLTSGTSQPLTIEGHWGVPVGTPAVTGNLTVGWPPRGRLRLRHAGSTGRHSGHLVAQLPGRGHHRERHRRTAQRLR